jgi:signal transduction histidine kinase
MPLEEVRRLYLDLSPGDLEDLGLTTACVLLMTFQLQKHIRWILSWITSMDFTVANSNSYLPDSAKALTSIGKHAKPKTYFRIKRKEKGSLLLLRRWHWL